MRYFLAALALPFILLGIIGSVVLYAILGLFAAPVRLDYPNGYNTAMKRGKP